MFKKKSEPPISTPSLGTIVVPKGHTAEPIPRVRPTITGPNSMNNPFGDLALGSLAVDTITGFRGIITGQSRYITGAPQVLLAPKAHGCEYQDARWFEIERVAVMQHDAVDVVSGRPAAKPEGK